jgi:hypothetical protein
VLKIDTRSAPEVLAVLEAVCAMSDTGDFRDVLTGLQAEIEDVRKGVAARIAASVPLSPSPNWTLPPNTARAILSSIMMIAGWNALAAEIERGAKKGRQLSGRVGRGAKPR